MKLNFLPKEEKFLEGFKEQSNIIFQAATILQEMFQNCQYAAEKIHKIEELEHQGDRIVREVALKLNKSFITPIDREDIHELTSVLDDVLDYIKSGAVRLSLFKIAECNKPAAALAELIWKASGEMRQAIEMLCEFKDVRPHVEKVKEYEREGDDLNRVAISELFQDTRPVLEIIKWKEIYERLETALDKCEDVVQIIEGIMLKHA